MFKGDLLTSVYECVLAFYASSVLSFLMSFFFFPTSCRQLLIHIIYGTPATCVCLCGSHCVVTLRLTLDEGMLLPLTHLMICLLVFAQCTREIPHNRAVMSNSLRQCFWAREAKEGIVPQNNAKQDCWGDNAGFQDKGFLCWQSRRHHSRLVGGACTLFQ